MSYLSLIPWTLQRRLLRYLLSQLDFLETDELDLDDLGITWGQRSVVQLKNVGLKLKKLPSLLHLPDNISVTSARIWMLKLTIPSDILTSGVVIEISGVEVQVRVEAGTGQEDQPQRRTQHDASLGEKRNLSRRTNPNVRDPGGGLGTRRCPPLDESLLCPDHAAHHLAESFLQTESREGRLELQAAIQTRSRPGREPPVPSVLNEEEFGVGLGEGYTLPSFIASYLVGITDRIQLHVKDVAVLGEFSYPNDGSNSTSSDTARTARLLLRISELSMEPVNVVQSSRPESRTKRKVTLDQLNVLVLPDAAMESPGPESSQTRSPVISDSQSGSQSLPSLTDTIQTLHPVVRSAAPSERVADRGTSLHQHPVSETTHDFSKPDLFVELSASTYTEANLDHYIDTPALRLSSSRSDLVVTSRSLSVAQAFTRTSSSSSGEDIFQDPSDANDGAHYDSAEQSMSEMGDSRASSIDMQMHTGASQETELLTPPPKHSVLSAQPVEDLTRSKIFTHDEAESMYASAMGSEGAPEFRTGHMPGGWNWSGEYEEASDRVNDTNQVKSRHCSTPQNQSIPPPTFETLFPSHRASLGAGALDTERLVDDDVILDSLPPTARQLLLVDRVTAWLSVTQDLEASTAPKSERPPQHGSSSLNADDGDNLDQQAPTNIQVDASTISSDKNSSKPTGTTENRDDFDQQSLPKDLLRTIEFEVTDVQWQFDMQIGKMLIAITKSDPKEPGELSKESEVSALSMPGTGVSVKANTITIALLEHVPEQSIMIPAINLPTNGDELLLIVSLAGLQYQTWGLSDSLKQRAQMSKVSLSHSKGRFLSFNHSSNLRSSLKESSAPQKDDVEISVTSRKGKNRIEIHTKALQMTVELGQVDDILSRSGGLSSLLELGSSIASSTTISSGTARNDGRRVKPRGVGFAVRPEIELQPHDDPGPTTGKINVRVDGLNLDIVGSECRLKASTSAVKVVHRTEGFGMQIDRILLEGPLSAEASEVPPLSAIVQSMRMEYLPVPNDQDLDRLLTILTPSQNKYAADDDIMLDTLLRQRRKGGVLRLTVTSLSSSLDDTSHIARLSKITSELSKLSTVAKYLPEDDRPGVLCLGLLKTLVLDIDSGDPMGKFQLKAQTVEGAHVNMPSLLAAQVSNVTINRNDIERILGESVTYSDSTKVPPMIMCRFVADEMDPTVKVKLFNLCVEYHVSFMAALQKQTDPLVVEKQEDASDKSFPSIASPSPPSSGEGATEFVRKTNISLAVRDSALAMNPRDVGGKALVLVTDAVLSSPLGESQDIKIETEVNKASVMVIEKVRGDAATDVNVPSAVSNKEGQTEKLLQLGFVTIAHVSSAISTVGIVPAVDGEHRSVNVDIGNTLLILETCADSTQTLGTILGGLSPPSPAVEISRYRTQIMPIEDLLTSFSGDAFITEPGSDVGLRAVDETDVGTTISDQEDVECLSETYQTESDYDEYGDEDDYQERDEDSDRMSESALGSEMPDSELDESILSVSVAPVSTTESVLRDSRHESLGNSLLDFRENHFGSSSNLVTSRGSRSPRKTSSNDKKRATPVVPFKVRVRNVHVIWNLYDGYDWQSTRDVISDAVKDIETRAAAQRPRRTSTLSPPPDGEESVIGDFLFNSVYIGIPANRDPQELASEINHDIDDQSSETGSHSVSTAIIDPSSRQQPMGRKRRKLKLARSKRHKITFELKGVATDILFFPPGSGEVQNSVDFRVKDLEIFDHIPTSTWKKFATYMRDAGEREANSSMIHVEVLNVKPVPDLAVSEMILKVTVLPLRLHVDQDAVDFMSRFFEFKEDESTSIPSASSGQVFLQRVEVNPVKVRLDFKPKRVDYGGLRSGRTTEFMNFFVLDQADMVLRRVILYGVSGFDRLGIMLNNIWSPDVKRNQLPGILAGLAPIRSLVNVGSGAKDLVVVPMREYRKDGRVVRSIQKGALAFAKTTSKELIGLGAKLAIGTQTVLETAETIFAPGSFEDGRHRRQAAGVPAIGDDDNNDDNDDDDDLLHQRNQISPYADQPVGVVQGLRGAYASLERDLLLAKDAIIAVPGEAVASGSASGAAKAVLKQAPTVILRPAIGASKAVGQTLLGAGNTLDKDNYRRMDEVCFSPDFLSFTFALLLHPSLGLPSLPSLSTSYYA